MEKWIKVLDSQTFEVSTEGRVRNTKTGTVYRACNGNSGYPQVCLKGDVNKTIMVHRLVAKAFIPNPKNKATVNHINGNKEDNRVENLEWNTQSENNQHMYDSGLKTYRPLHYKGKFGAEHNKSIAVEQYLPNGQVLATFGSISEAGRELGMGMTTIHWACEKGTLNLKTQTYFRKVTS